MFAHDTEIALACAAALVNTGRQSEERLPDVAALDAFVAQRRWTGERNHDEAGLHAVRAPRGARRGAARRRGAAAGTAGRALDVVRGRGRRAGQRAAARGARAPPA